MSARFTQMSNDEIIQQKIFLAIIQLDWCVKADSCEALILVSVSHNKSMLKSAG